MPRDDELLQLSAALGAKLAAAGKRLVTAESCTAGWIAKSVTDVAGSSQWFDSGYVTYSNEAKTRELQVSAETLVRHGAVSEATVREMAAGALRASGADVAIAVSGIAGPDGGGPGRPVGTVWFCTAQRRGPAIELDARMKRFAGDRDQVRRGSVEFALSLLLGLELEPAAR